MTGPLQKVSRYHDYFSTALPSPQKSPGNVRAMPTGTMPVFAGLSNSGGPTRTPMTFVRSDNGIASGQGFLGISTGSEAVLGAGTTTSTNRIAPSNLYVDPTDGNATFGFEINALRYAFQLQKMYERDARSGTRYTEMIRAHFGVVSDDARQQRPELLGATHQRIDNFQVLQTSSTDSVSPQANPAALSLTNIRSNFTKSFTEHGYVIIVGAIRTDHTYQQGVERL